MKHIVLINPNTSVATTSMMIRIVSCVLPAQFSIQGMTASTSVPMILNDRQLTACEPEVVEMGQLAAARAAGIIIGAFGDPGVKQLRPLVNIPVIGICEASMLEASAGGRRFGIATVTPGLVDNFTSNAEQLGLGHLYMGARLTDGDPEDVVSNPTRLQSMLAVAVEQSFKLDGAEAVIIGGGPLGQASLALQQYFPAPVIAPIPTATRLLVHHIETSFDRS